MAKSHKLSFALVAWSLIPARAALALAADPTGGESSWDFVKQEGVPMFVQDERDGLAKNPPPPPKPSDLTAFAVCAPPGRSSSPPVFSMESGRLPEATRRPPIASSTSSSDQMTPASSQTAARRAVSSLCREA